MTTVRADPDLVLNDDLLDTEAPITKTWRPREFTIQVRRLTEHGPEHGTNTMEGVVRGPLAIYKDEPTGRWSITHLATGLAICWADRKKDAQEVGDGLLDLLPDPWWWADLERVVTFADPIRDYLGGWPGVYRNDDRRTEP